MKLKFPDSWTPDEVKLYIAWHRGDELTDYEWKQLCEARNTKGDPQLQLAEEPPAVESGPADAYDPLNQHKA